jgi:hypothetical protein
MCCCDQPNINGQLGYKWQPNDAPSKRPISAPDISEGDVILYDEPGRCGGTDSHSHHYTLVKSYSRLVLHVRHGGGDDLMFLSLYGKQPEIFDDLDSNGRYWIFNALYHAYGDGKRRGAGESETAWRTAAAEKRIKTRKVRGGSSVKVWIED